MRRGGGREIKFFLNPKDVLSVGGYRLGVEVRCIIGVDVFL